MLQSLRIKFVCAKGLFSMDSFKDRKKKFEEKFAHDQDLQFKVESRASKMFGLWIAEKMGFSEDDATTYAKEVVIANLEEAGTDDVIRKVKADIAGKGIEISDHVLRSELDDFMEKAKQQFMEEAD